MFTYRIELNDDMNTAKAPLWAKSERYSYCEDFSQICSHKHSDLLKRLRNAVMSLMF